MLNDWISKAGNSARVRRELAVMHNIFDEIAGDGTLLAAEKGAALKSVLTSIKDLEMLLEGRHCLTPEQAGQFASATLVVLFDAFERANERKGNPFSEDDLQEIYHRAGNGLLAELAKTFPELDDEKAVSINQ